MTYWEALLSVLLVIGGLALFGAYIAGLIHALASFQRRWNIVGWIMVALPVLAFIFGMPFAIMAGS